MATGLLGFIANLFGKKRRVKQGNLGEGAVQLVKANVVAAPFHEARVEGLIKAFADHRYVLEDDLLL